MFDTGLGGGIATQGLQFQNVGPDVTLRSCTIVNNTAKHGGGVWSNKNGVVDLTILKNCIVWDNKHPANCSNCTAQQIGEKDGSVEVRYSDVYGFDNTPVAGQIVGNVDMGGSPTQTNIGDNETAHNPDFKNPTLGDYHIICGSPCINAGNSTGFPTDTFDVDNDIGSGELVPANDLEDRVVNSVIDMGAFEASASSNCNGDINGDGVVDVDDLLAVINAWSPSQNCPAPCAADIAPTSSGICINLNGVVDVDDLLVIINQWGPCPGSGLTGSLSIPDSIEDCYNVVCSGLTGTEWSECSSKCIQAVCQQYPEECE